MHRGIPFSGRVLPAIKNISRTWFAAKAESETDLLGCLYIAANSWPAGHPPFCGLPKAPHSAYCPTHDALCRRTVARPVAEVRR